MAYPWPSFGTFLFKGNECAIWGSDSGWNREISKSQKPALGASKDTIVVLAAGSKVRQFDCLLSPSRYAILEALVGTTATFTDWDRPTPGTGQAFLAKLSQQGWTFSTCSDGTTQRRIKARVELVSQ